VTEPLVRALASALRNPWIPMPRSGVVGGPGVVEAMRARREAERIAAHPAMAPWLAVISAAQAVVATDEWILDIPDEDWDPKMLVLRDALAALEEPPHA